MYVYEFRPLIGLSQDGAQKKGELKILDSPTMFMKTKENDSDILTYPTMLMKTGHLVFVTHDILEKMGS